MYAEICGSCGGACEDHCLLGCYAMWSHRCSSTFWMSTLPLSSLQKTVTFSSYMFLVSTSVD